MTFLSAACKLHTWSIVTSALDVQLQSLPPNHIMGFACCCSEVWKRAARPITGFTRKVLPLKSQNVPTHQVRKHR